VSRRQEWRQAGRIDASAVEAHHPAQSQPNTPILWNGDEVVRNHKYIMRITGDDPAGKAELDTFILPESKYPVIVTTSRLLNTGVDAKTCKLIVLDQRIESMTTFKQIIGHDYDPFDLICHVAYDQPPLTRKERAERVRQRNYFARYGGKARAVMEALLDKYADQGIEAVESPDAFKVIPFPELGTPVELIQAFGGRRQYQAALRDLEAKLYETA